MVTVQGWGQGRTVIRSPHTPAHGTHASRRAMWAEDCVSALGPGLALSLPKDPGVSLALPTQFTPRLHDLHDPSPFLAVQPSTLPV